MSEMARALATLALVLGGTAGVLGTLDAVPGWIQGEPRGVRRVGSIEEAERALRARLVIPAFFPDTLRWPPTTVRIARDGAPAVALGFEARAGGLALVLAQTVGGAGPISPRLLPETTVLRSDPLRVGTSPGVLRRVVGADGAVWTEVAWAMGDRRLALRGKGGVEDLVRMARSAHPEPR